MGTLSVRWSEHEARKDYARPFGVSFLNSNGEALTSIAANGQELVYYQQFQAAALTLLGELFLHPAVEASKTPQKTWLEVIADLVPVIDEARFVPVSGFEQVAGRTVQIEIAVGEETLTQMPAHLLLDYQEAQAVIAHQSGRLLRVPSIEDVDDDVERHRTWVAWLRERLDHLGSDFAVAGWDWS